AAWPGRMASSGAGAGHRSGETARPGAGLAATAGDAVARRAPRRGAAWRRTPVRRPCRPRPGGPAKLVPAGALRRPPVPAGVVVLAISYGRRPPRAAATSPRTDARAGRRPAGWHV